METAPLTKANGRRREETLGGRDGAYCNAKWKEPPARLSVQAELIILFRIAPSRRMRCRVEGGRIRQSSAVLARPWQRIGGAPHPNVLGAVHAAAGEHPGGRGECLLACPRGVPNGRTRDDGEALSAGQSSGISPTVSNSATSPTRSVSEIANVRPVFSRSTASGSSQIGRRPA